MHFFALAIAAGGLVFSSATFAKPDHNSQIKNVYISYLSAVEENSSGMKKVDDDDEIGSTYVMVVSANIGGFNRADGSRSGAYGDGEFAE